jgi:hypothetical protein
MYEAVPSLTRCHITARICDFFPYTKYFTHPQNGNQGMSSLADGVARYKNLKNQSNNFHSTDTTTAVESVYKIFDSDSFIKAQYILIIVNLLKR